MPFYKGNIKSEKSGRKKGVKNKPVLEKTTVAQLLKNMNMDVLTHLLTIYQKGDLKDIEKVRLLQELMTYVYPKPKSEISLQVSPVLDWVNVNTKEVIEAVKKDPFIE